MEIPARPESARGGKALRLLALLAVAAVGAVAVFRMPAIPQDPAYHQFADRRPLWGIPNFQNVVSNLPFLLVGPIGVLRLLRRRRDEGTGRIDAGEAAAWLCVFVGIALTGLGSAYYHLAPSNATLVWDRLPISLSLMAFFVCLLGDRISERAYRLLLWPLLGIGAASVLYWYAGELRGQGDLRLYALVQYLPLLLIPLVVALYRPRYSHGSLVWIALGWYAVAKVCELRDPQIFAATSGLVGGHALKHLAAAEGCWTLVRLFSVRKRL